MQSQGRTRNPPRNSRCAGGCSDENNIHIGCNIIVVIDRVLPLPYIIIIDDDVVVVVVVDGGASVVVIVRVILVIVIVVQVFCDGIGR